MPESVSGASVDAVSSMGMRHGRNDDTGRMERIAFCLHEMCQPLMALQCRLEIGRMVDTAEGYEEAVREGLSEYDRLLASVEALREEVRLGLEASRV